MSESNRDGAESRHATDQRLQTDGAFVADETFVEVESVFAFDETVAAVVRAIEDAGMAIFARIDHAANARDVGLSMPAAIVLIYGAAKGGTPVMLLAPRAALDLPLRLLVHETEPGRVRVAFHPMGTAFGDLGVPHSLAGRLESAQRLILKEIVQ